MRSVITLISTTTTYINHVKQLLNAQSEPHVGLLDWTSRSSTFGYKRIQNLWKECPIPHQWDINNVDALCWHRARKVKPVNEEQRSIILLFCCQLPREMSALTLLTMIDGASPLVQRVTQG